MKRIDPLQIKEGQYIERGMLYDVNNKLIGSVPMKEYPSQEEYSRDIEESVRIEMQHDNGAPQEWTPAISIKELCRKDFPDKKWIVEDIFERATVGQLSAAPNQWKTWIMWHMAICIAMDKKVFGVFAVDKQGVLIVNEEDPERMLKERSLMLLGEIEDISIYIHAEKGMKLEDETVGHLLKEAEEKEIGVVIFDSLSVMHTADENSAKEMGEVFEQMKKFTRKGITVLFTNHHRKKSQKRFEKDDIQEQVRGSTVINAVPSGHITCEETTIDGSKFIIIRQAKLKGARKIDSFLVRIKEADDKIAFIYESKYEESLDAATKLKEKLYQIVKESDTWFGVKDLMETVSLSERPIRDQLKVLIKEGQIQKKTRAVLMKQRVPVPERERSSGQEYLYSRLGDTDEESEEGIDPESLF